MAVIVFEGNECCGKTTIIDLVYDRLTNLGFRVLKTREPGGLDSSEAIRGILLDQKFSSPINGHTEAMLYAAARSELVEKVIVPAKEEYDFILLDRFVYSSLVYQGLVRGLGETFVFDLNKSFYRAVDPDICLYLKVSPRKRRERMENRMMEQKNRLDLEQEEFFALVDHGYDTLTRQFAEIRQINADQPILDVLHDCLASCMDMIVV